MSSPPASNFALQTSHSPTMRNKANRQGRRLLGLRISDCRLRIGEPLSEPCETKPNMDRMGNLESHYYGAQDGATTRSSLRSKANGGSRACLWCARVGMKETPCGVTSDESSPRPSQACSAQKKSGAALLRNDPARKRNQNQVRLSPKPILALLRIVGRAARPPCDHRMQAQGRSRPSSQKSIIRKNCRLYATESQALGKRKMPRFAKFPISPRLSLWPMLTVAWSRRNAKSGCTSALQAVLS